MPGPRGVKGNRGDIGGTGEIIFNGLLYVYSIYREKRQTAFADSKYFFFILQIRLEAGGRTKEL